MAIEIPIFKISLLIGLLWMLAAAIRFLFFSEQADKETERRKSIVGLPTEIREADFTSAFLGWEIDLRTPIYFPDKVRGRHVHIIGATGSGKTESVLLNLIDQDAKRNYPLVILDAKGDESFVSYLRMHPQAKDNLLVFDPGKPKESVHYNPIGGSSRTEAAMRLFNSMVWSEEFYKTRAREMLMRVAETHDKRNRPITLAGLKSIFESATSLSSFLGTEDCPVKVSESEYAQLAGLVAQINQLCYGNLGKVIAGDPVTDEGKKLLSLNIKEAIQDKKVLYFRLPALVDPATTMTVGRLLIAELAQYAADVQAGNSKPLFTPVFLDEFGSLACPAFLELIAKARSAGLALHFSHQSMGDLAAAGDNFPAQITDNSSTKIVLRIYDPETAEMIAKTFGTKSSSKETRQVVTGTLGAKEETGAMSVRDVKEFRADPDRIKSLPTGCAYVLMNHALRPNGRAGDVFCLRFPLPRKYEEETNDD